MPFEPGQSGNPTGHKREAKFRAALDRAIAQDQADRLRSTAEKLLDLAASGEAWAVKELADRLDGKPAQTIGGTGEDGGFTFELKAPWIDAIAKSRGWA